VNTQISAQHASHAFFVTNLRSGGRQVSILEVRGAPALNTYSDEWVLAKWNGRQSNFELLRAIGQCAVTRGDDEGYVDIL
jgi:hypothetical protein